MKAGLTLGVEAGDPTVSALARDPHRLRNVSDGLAFLADPLHEQQTSMERETSVTVRHRRPPGL